MTENARKWWLLGIISVVNKLEFLLNSKCMTHYVSKIY